MTSSADPEHLDLPSVTSTPPRCAGKGLNDQHGCYKEDVSTGVPPIHSDTLDGPCDDPEPGCPDVYSQSSTVDLSCDLLSPDLLDPDAQDMDDESKQNHFGHSTQSGSAGLTDIESVDGGNSQTVFCEIESSESKHSLRTKDTLLLYPEPEIRNKSESSSGGPLKESLTRMPSSFLDLRSSMRLNESNSQTVSCESESSESKHSLRTEDTLILNPEPEVRSTSSFEWSESSSGGPLKGSLTRMPSSFLDLRSSMRSNESLQLHHNLTLLLETTRVNISHDEKQLEEIDWDISRIRKEYFTGTVRLDRLKTRFHNMGDIICELAQWESQSGSPKLNIPGVDIPEVNTHGVETPKADMPNIYIPEGDIPNKDIPKVSIPGMDGREMNIAGVDTDIMQVDTPRMDTGEV